MNRRRFIAAALAGASAPVGTCTVDDSDDVWRPVDVFCDVHDFGVGPQTLASVLDDFAEHSGLGWEVLEDGRIRFSRELSIYTQPSFAVLTARTFNVGDLVDALTPCVLYELDRWSKYNVAGSQSEVEAS
jgi:hypothetical protein